LVRAAVNCFESRYDEIMEGRYRGELVRDVNYEGAVLVKSCKELLRRTVFRQEEVLRLELRGRRVLHDLMDLFWEGVSEFLYRQKIGTASYGQKIYLLIAESYRALFEKRFAANPNDGKYLGLQLVTDYVSGMTDGYACRLHEDLING
jgi:dGTPase